MRKKRTRRKWQRHCNNDSSGKKKMNKDLSARMDGILVTRNEYSMDGWCNNKRQKASFICSLYSIFIFSLQIQIRPLHIPTTIEREQQQPSHVYPVWIEPQFSNRSEWHAFPIVCFVFAVFVRMRERLKWILQSSSDNVFVLHAIEMCMNPKQILYNLAGNVVAAEKAVNLTVSIANKSEYKWANAVEEVERIQVNLVSRIPICMYWNRTVSMAPGLVVAPKNSATVATIILCMYNMNRWANGDAHMYL